MLNEKRFKVSIMKFLSQFCGKVNGNYHTLNLNRQLMFWGAGAVSFLSNFSKPFHALRYIPSPVAATSMRDYPVG